MHFSKYTGCGNDFIIIDNRSLFFSPDTIPHLCHRQLGIGADGLILLEESSEADFRMRIFNSDGKETEMCGNGVRCLLKFIQDKVGPYPSITIQTMQRKLNVESIRDQVKVEMGEPQEIRWNLSLKYPVHHLDTGVPHAVFFVDNVETLDMMSIGKELRYHPMFAPRGANVNAVEVNGGRLRVRTYERGVEAETLACGTGAVASALAAAHLKGLTSPVNVMVKSGELLEIGFQMVGERFTGVTMTGPAVKVFEGFCTLQKQ